MNPAIRTRYLEQRAETFRYEVVTSQGKGESRMLPAYAHALGLHDFCRYPDPDAERVHWLFRTEEAAFTFIKSLPVGRLIWLQ